MSRNHENVPSHLLVWGLVWAALALCISAFGCDSTGDAPGTTSGVVVPAGWEKSARIAPLELDLGTTTSELNQLVNQAAQENVSIAVINSGLAAYLNASDFTSHIALLDRASKRAHESGISTLVYYPSLEVFTENGVSSPNSMFKDHPDWVERGLDGKANVVLGAQDESAWMSPNSPYRAYYLDRIRKLAASSLDGVWVDVATYMETDVTDWTGASAYSAEAFRLWSLTKGLGGAAGLPLPGDSDFDDATFRAWIKWRHENLAEFLEDVRKAAHAVDPDFIVAVETSTVDSLWATVTGLDGTYGAGAKNFIKVYKPDVLSSSRGMQDAHPEDFTSLVAMNKWAMATERGATTWSFSLGFQPLDAGLVMSSLLANGLGPFESKTPDYATSVSSTFRTQWFAFVRDNAKRIFGPKRIAHVGVWYDPNSRDYGDHLEDAGGSGLYVHTTPPTPDPDWWTTDPTDSTALKPHQGGWRGVAHDLIEMGIPFEPIIARDELVLADIVGLEVIILPSVTSMSAAQVAMLEAYVSGGGVLLATNEVPAQLDEWGNAVAINPLESVFQFKADEFESRLNAYGKGLAIFRPNFMANQFYHSAVTNKSLHYSQVSELETLLRIHTPKTIELASYQNVYLEQSMLDSKTRLAYLVNYSGLKQPVQSQVKEVELTIYAPAGLALSKITAFTPTAAGDSGNVGFSEIGEAIYRAKVKVDQLSILELGYVDAPPPPPPYTYTFNFPPDWEEASLSGLDFIMNKMRNPARAFPYNNGVFTNLLDRTGTIQIYAYGHHVTAEHMGLLLRTSACMQDQAAFDAGLSFVDQAMVSPLFNVIRWAVDKTHDRPYVELSDDDDWVYANAPLDDLRAIRGLLDGARNFDRPDSLAVAKKALAGLYWTTVTDSDYKPALDFPAYPGGLLGYAFDFLELNDTTLTPKALATGRGRLTKDLIPIDYQDLYTLGLAAEHDHRWRSVLLAGTDLLLSSEIGTSGLYYNGLQINGVYTGDFENRDTNEGKHLKTIQVLWIALHLVRIDLLDDAMIDPARKAAGVQSSARSLAFYKNFYQRHGRVPEYLTYGGLDVPTCTGTNPTVCLGPDENSINGEVRIYAQIARLAYYHNDITFAEQLINEKILTDRISNPADPRYGQIGPSTANVNDAEAWNVLESVLSMCLISKTEP